MSDVDSGAGPPPGAVMVQLLAGFQLSQAVFVVAGSGVATILEQEGPQPIAELARRTGNDAGALARLVRALAPVGVFTVRGDEVAITPVGATLSEKHPQSLNGVARMWMETHYLPFSELSYAVRTGRPVAERYLGKPFFEWLAEDPGREALFSRAMADLTSSVRAGMFDDYRLPPGRIVADIGGSDGSVLVELLTRDDDPQRQGIVFDRPTMVSVARSAVAGSAVADRVEFVAGDFFDSVPRADVYILAYILHDWNDEESARILASIATAAEPGARLLVVEGVVPPGDEPHLTKAVDLIMLGLFTGRERTEQEYRDLLDGAGFTVDRIVSTRTPFSIIEATLR